MSNTVQPLPAGYAAAPRDEQKDYEAKGKDARAKEVAAELKRVGS